MGRDRRIATVFRFSFFHVTTSTTSLSLNFGEGHTF
jgi:hypothetical protein